MTDEVLEAWEKQPTVGIFNDVALAFKGMSRTI